MANLMYQLPTDNLAATGTLTVQSGTEDTAYSKANIYDGNPAKPAKLTTTTGAWRWDFGSAKQLDIVAVIHHNLTAGLNVRIQGNATDAWGAPSLDQAFMIPANHEDGMPVNPWLDLSALVPIAGNRTFQFWRLVVVGVNAAAVAIGDVWLGQTKRQMAINIHWGLEETDEHPVVEHETSHKVQTVYDLNTKVRKIAGEVETTDAGASDLLAWHRACSGRVKLTLVVLDPSKNDCLLARWMAPELAVQRNFKNSNLVKLGWQELSRGMPF